jgi:hypothetical protein
MATSAFGKAFAEARKAGNTEFTFNGKQYNTRLKGETGPQVEPVHIDAEAGMTRGTRRSPGAGRGFVNPDAVSYDARDAEAGMSRGTNTYSPDTSGVDAVKNLADKFNVPMGRTDEAGNAYKRGGKVKKMESGGKTEGGVRGWGLARGARKAKVY